MAKKSTAQVIPIGDNRREALDRMFAEIDDLGKTEGAGENSRATLAIRCTEWAANGMADTGDAYTLYDRYMQSVEGVASAFGGSRRLRERGDAGKEGRKQNASKFRQFLKLGGLKIIDPVAMINRAAGVVKEARQKGTITFGPFEALLNIAREQCANTQNELTDQEMIDVNQPEEKPDPEEADALGSIVARVSMHEDKYGSSDTTIEVKDKLKERIAELGGTMKERKAAEKAQKKKKA